jgi:hypothetical protein
LQGNRFARGQIRTRLIDGACQAVQPSGEPISEEDRLSFWLEGQKWVHPRDTL